MKTLTQMIFVFFCLSLSNAFAQSSCRTDSDCNNNKFCDGVERCVNKRCERGTPPCTEPGFKCDPAQNKCVERMCTQDFMCGNDRLWCNGEEACRPELGIGFLSLSYAKGHWGCHRINKPCANGETCQEETRTCSALDCSRREVRDRDGDGHANLECGGDDCDDDDPRVNPSRTEICDREHLDEDCDPTTVASKSDDRDGDGYYPERCCNRKANGDLFCGTDCDDNNAQLIPGSQFCPFDGSLEVNLCGGGAAQCGPNKVCHAQPNGTGVCAH